MQSRGNLLERFDLLFLGVLPHEIELEQSAKEESCRPQPLRPLVIAPSLGGREVVGIIAVDVPWMVLQIDWV